MTGNVFVSRGVRCGFVGGVLLACALVASALAARGGLDPSYGDAGVVITSPPKGYGSVWGLAEDGDGRIVVVGTAPFRAFAVARYESDGSLDTSFADGGVATPPFRPDESSGGNDVAMQGDKIVVVGFVSRFVGPHRQYRFAIARYRSDGDLDRSFSGDGLVQTKVGRDGDAHAVAVQREGRIVVAGVSTTRSGHWSATATRYLANGDLDRRFDRVRLTVPDDDYAAFHDVAVLPSGRILLAGEIRGRLLLARLREDGSFDRSFGGGDGKVLVPAGRQPERHGMVGNSLAVQPSGHILVQGTAYNPRRGTIALARFDEHGVLDQRWGDDGVVRTAIGEFASANDMALLPNGKIVVAGQTSKNRQTRFTVLRYLRNGKLDSTFDGDGVFTLPVDGDAEAHDVVVQRDGRAVVGGEVRLRPRTQFTLVRFLAE